MGIYDRSEGFGSFKGRKTPGCQGGDFYADLRHGQNQYTADAQIGVRPFGYCKFRDRGRACDLRRNRCGRRQAGA